MTDLTSILDVVIPSSGSGGASGRYPRIGWQNLFADDDATLTVSSEQSAAPFINALDGKEYTYWKAALGGTQSLQLDLSSSRSVNYCALHGHNLHLVGGTVSLQRWNGSTWDTLGSVSPTTAAPVMLSVTTAAGTRFRLLFASTGAVSSAIVYLGRAVDCERGCWEGMTPPWMGRVTEATTTRSESGVLLGRSVRFKGVEFAMDFEHLTIPFIRDEWMPFAIASETGPFFVMWNPQEYPEDVAFCWVDDPAKDLKRPRLTTSLHMSTGVKVRGRIIGLPA